MKVLPTRWRRKPASIEITSLSFYVYLTAVLRLSYDNAEVTIDLRRAPNLQNILQKNARLFLGTIRF